MLPATVLLGLALLAGPGADSAAAAPCEPVHGKAAQRIAARVDALRADAERAAERFEAARKKSRAQRAAAVRSRRAVHRGERRMRTFRSSLGSIARSQYRNNGLWAPSVRLVLAPSPEALFERLRAQRQGEHAVSRLVSSSRKAHARLVRKRARAQAVLRRLETATRREAAAKDGIERRLAEARRLQMTGPAGKSRHARHDCPRAGAPGRPEGSGPVEFADDSSNGEQADGGHWTTPVARSGYTLSAGYRSSGNRWARGHTGQDFAVPTGTPVRAVGEGTVEVTSGGDGFGNQIVIRHPDGFYTQYAHLSAIQAERGEHVEAGEQIGLSGNTGNSTGPHLHFEARVTPALGSDVAPVPWLRQRGVVL